MRHQNRLPTHIITSLEIVLGAKFPFLRRGHFNIEQFYDNMRTIINFVSGLTLIYEEYVFALRADVSLISVTDDVQFYFFYTLLRQGAHNNWLDLDPSDIGVLLKEAQADTYVQYIGI